MGSGFQISLSDWTTGTFHNGFTFTPDLSSISLLIANQTSVYIRLVDNSNVSINGTTVATAGTDRIDNFTVSGDSMAVPDSLPFSFTACFLLGFLIIAHRIPHPGFPLPNTVNRN